VKPPTDFGQQPVNDHTWVVGTKFPSISYVPVATVIGMRIAEIPLFESVAAPPEIGFTIALFQSLKAR